MVYIYKKVIKGKSYYYLRVSKRVKGKIVVKDIAYLGKDLSKIKSKLDKLPEIYKKEIKQANRNIQKFIGSEHYLKKVRELKLKENSYLDKSLLEEIEAIKIHFSKKFLKLDRKSIEEVYENFLVDFAFNTTSIEGNTITLEEADRLLREGLTPKDRTVREVYDLENTKKVFFEIQESKKEINHDFIIYLHDVLLDKVDERKGYRIREIRVFRSKFEASSPQYIKTDMGILLKWFMENKDLHPLVLVGIFHQKFEKIHPFYDGNGRTGRILMNYMLMQLGYPPFFIRRSGRGKYLDAMSKGDKAALDEIKPEDYKVLINYLAEEMINSYWNNFLV